MGIVTRMPVRGGRESPRAVVTEADDGSRCGRKCAFWVVALPRGARGSAVASFVRKNRD